MFVCIYVLHMEVHCHHTSEILGCIEFFLTLPFETVVTSAFLPQVIREQRSRKNPATICHLIKFENKEILEHTVVILAHNKRLFQYGKRDEIKHILHYQQYLHLACC